MWEFLTCLTLGHEWVRESDRGKLANHHFARCCVCGKVSPGWLEWKRVHPLTSA